MKEDTIKRSDAIETAYQLRHKPNDEEWGEWLKAFNAIPSADIPQGEWIDKAISIIDDMQREGIIDYEQAREYRMRARIKGATDGNK